MKEKLTLAINLWYKEWLKTNDPFKDDFEAILENNFPDYKFGLSKNNEWFFIMENQLPELYN